MALCWAPPEPSTLPLPSLPTLSVLLPLPRHAIHRLERGPYGSEICLLGLLALYSAVENRHVRPELPATSAARAGTSKLFKEGLYQFALPASHGPVDAFVGAANTVAVVVPANLNVPAPSSFLSCPQAALLPRPLRLNKRQLVQDGNFPRWIWAVSRLRCWVICIRLWQGR